ncbi:hypothetical protein MTO96_021123 [Rhipicephalus appendiculatus]
MPRSQIEDHAVGSPTFLERVHRNFLPAGSSASIWFRLEPKAEGGEENPASQYILRPACALQATSDILVIVVVVSSARTSESTRPWSSDLLLFLFGREEWQHRVPSPRLPAAEEVGAERKWICRFDRRRQNGYVSSFSCAVDFMAPRWRLTEKKRARTG